MTLHDILCKANLAHHQGRPDEAKGWVVLARIIAEAEARDRLAGRRVDPDQQDHDEYIAEMSLGAKTYRIPR